jgi:hypothetical protein
VDVSCHRFAHRRRAEMPVDDPVPSRQSSGAVKRLARRVEPVPARLVDAQVDARRHSSSHGTESPRGPGALAGLRRDPHRSNSAANNAVIQAPQNVTRAEHYLTSQSANAASQPTSVNGGQVTVNVGARSISTVVLTL